MQSSCNLIKNKNTLISGNKNIQTNYSGEKKIILDKDDDYKTYDESEIISKQYEDLAVGILLKAKSDAEKIMLEARTEAVTIEKEAYEKGYAQGKDNGYEDGYEEGYKVSTDKAIADCEDRVTNMINKSNSILLTASSDYREYMDEKKNEIKELIFEISKIVCNVNFQKDESILKIIEPIIENYKGEKSLIIRANTKYSSSLKDIIGLWKNTYNIKGEIFILEDPLMEIGNAIVETDKGKATVGIDISFEKLEKMIADQMSGGNNA